MTYEYACTACGHAWEAEQSISEPALKTCPNCHQDTARRQVSGGAGFILKGGGWYADLYGSSKKSESSKSETAPAKSDSTKSDSTKSDSTSSGGSDKGSSGTSGSSGSSGSPTSGTPSGSKATGAASGA